MPKRHRNASKTAGSRESDDFTVIEGIGEVRQRWLRESLRVHTYRDLAALSADEVESRLKAEGQAASRSAIETWIARARELAAVASRLSTGRKSESRRVEEGTESIADQPDWLPFASFVVEFQSRKLEGGEAGKSSVAYRTAVHHVEADDDETWLGITSQLLSKWMLERADYEAQQMSRDVAIQPEEPPTAAPREPRANVEITAIRLFQRPETETARGVSVFGEAFSGSVKGDEPFVSEVSFELKGTTASEAAAKGQKYRVQLYAENLATAAWTHLGDTMPISVAADQPSYAAVLPECTLPAGVYRLSVLARREGDGAHPEDLEAPLLRVV
jgi:hypothetical protein